MPRKRRDDLREATYEDIKTAARKLMADQGTAGLSLRGIARELGMTAPALYYYYDNLDSLITTLIVENYHHLADAMESARDAHADQVHRQQLVAVMQAYRRWALEHPIDFQLIYGNPIPGYEAPGDLTVPAASRALSVSAGIIADGLGKGVFHVPVEAAQLPESVCLAFRQIAEERGYKHTPVEAIYLAVIGWTRAQGLISLEIYNSLQPVVGDTEAFYQHQIDTLIHLLE